MDIGDFNVKFDNLFNGQKELEDSVNDVFNQNWRILFNNVRPNIEGAIRAIMKDRLQKVFNYVPTNYFIEDILV